MAVSSSGSQVQAVELLRYRPQAASRTCGRCRRLCRCERSEFIALACALPTEYAMPLANWSCPELVPPAGKSRSWRPLSTDSWRLMPSSSWQHPPRASIPGQGRPGAQPVCRDLGRRATGQQGVCHCANEETFHLVLQQYFVMYEPAAPMVAAACAGLAGAPLA